jgi:hypothetical protein
MGQTTDQIEADIQDKREALRSNFDELENKVKSVTDWRRHFEKHPGTMMAAALGAGALLATMSGGRNRRRVRAMSSGEISAAAGASRKASDHQQKGVARQTWDPIKGALIGLALTRATGFIEQLLPGFQEQLKKHGSAKGESSRSSGDSEGSNSVQGEGDDYEAPRRYGSVVWKGS